MLGAARSVALWSPRAFGRSLSTITKPQGEKTICVDGKHYPTDDYTNLTPKILQKVERKLHLCEKHPINLFKQRIVNYFNKTFVNRRGNSVFSVYDQLSPVVTTVQNFDSLLVPKDHPSRNPRDSFYINRTHMLRAHTSAHQKDLISSGLDRFLVIGDVYRRDEIDRRHYPVFHQVEAVRLFTKEELFQDKADSLDLFQTLPTSQSDLNERQASHSMETAKMLEFDLKKTLEGMVSDIFDKKLEFRWVNTEFPFTHPSFELEVKLDNIWVEMLGCGIMRQELLNGSGVSNKVGWAFGIGLERIAMPYYSIEDIRAFWSEDPAFHSQFNFTDPYKRIVFKPISEHPPCKTDMSFWIPEEFAENDFYDLVRTIGGDIIQEVSQIDVFTNKKTSRTSHCYRIVYRHLEKTLTQEEANEIHNQIGNAAAAQLNVELRR